jgi:tRNA modification GTPase
VKQTIFALASAQGRAGVAVIRLSGPQASEVLRTLSGRLPKPRFATYSPLRYGPEVVDQALCIYFKSPHSFTGEDCVEFHIHGSRAVMDRLYAIFTEMGLRHAEAGEFSRRAFENGKLDLTQAEAISDLVEAESQAQRQQALMQLNGGFKARYTDWRQSLLKILAHIEAIVDFPDEDIPDHLSDEIRRDIESLRNNIHLAIVDSKRGQQIREGYRIIIMGRPNAGKSSLFNALLGEDAAIVTPVAGTTRDILQAHIRIGAYSALLYDTAGLRETDDIIESEGIRRAWAKGEIADLRLWVVDSSIGQAEFLEPKAGDYIIFNKIDQAHKTQLENHKNKIPNNVRFFETDLTKGSGLKDILSQLESDLEVTLALNTFPAATRERHIDRLSEAQSCLTRALESGFRVPELMAEDIRQAIAGFDALFGRVDVEEVLDHIFSSFCIGK